MTRKRETERIERENHAFAKRLFERGASLSKKKFDDDYQQHMRYKNQIQKLKLSSRLNTKELTTAVYEIMNETKGEGDSPAF